MLTFKRTLDSTDKIIGGFYTQGTFKLFSKLGNTLRLREPTFFRISP